MNTVELIETNERLIASLYEEVEAISNEINRLSKEIHYLKSKEVSDKFRGVQLDLFEGDSYGG